MEKAIFSTCLILNFVKESFWGIVLVFWGVNLNFLFFPFLITHSLEVSNLLAKLMNLQGAFKHSNPHTPGHIIRGGFKNIQTIGGFITPRYEKHEYILYSYG